MGRFRLTGLRLRVMMAFATLLILGATVVWGSATPVSAHAPGHCGHYDYPNGGWYTDYVYHYWSGNHHYNVYDHYLYGAYQHTEYVLCN